MQIIRCIFCGESDRPDPIAIQENSWNGLQCVRCGLIYVSPRPSPDEIVNLYAHDSAHTDSAVLARNELHRRLCARHSLRILRKYLPAGDLLEIGAGGGFFLNEARKAGFNVKGIELNPVQAQTIVQNGIACDTRPISLAFTGEQFDVIYHCDVTSHFFDPIAEFKAMAARLKPGGLLMFETGNFGDISPQWYKHIPSFQYPDHLFFLTAANVPVLLDKSGFALIRNYRYSRGAEMRLTRHPDERRAATVDAGDHGQYHRSRMHELKSMVRYALTYKLGRILRPDSSPQTMIVVARKNG